MSGPAEGMALLALMIQEHTFKANQAWRQGDYTESWFHREQATQARIALQEIVRLESGEGS